jgi:hypothetical protein
LNNAAANETSVTAQRERRATTGLAKYFVPVPMTMLSYRYDKGVAKLFNSFCSDDDAEIIQRFCRWFRRA